ncbi:MAG: cysteine--tRNA ligase [Candidatus Omnitrophica bacterium]|nr:cysteine--tRNA ligase [Candidatus Omnitrophota bacterium]
MLKIYNSLTKTKDFFTPQEELLVKMYVCGVTVYDDCHIGHARSLYVFEVIRKYLKYRGYKVQFIRNITDIDDKIINRAKELGVDWKELANKYIDNYYQDLKALGISKADKEPRATENVGDMIKCIERLIDKEYAYVTENGVYLSVRKLKSYGKLSGQSIDKMREGVRISKDETKEDPLDFALWKKVKGGEPFWKSPWGQGRPGWHIECSVMSQKYLKTDTLDIHGGGRDLIFPHHENECAQAESLTGKVFANYWIHHGLLTIDNQKMSKSLGNFVTIQDAVSKYSADILKIFYLQAHYSSSVDFSEKKMKEAKKAYERIQIFMNRIGSIREVKIAKDAEGLLKQFRDRFIEAMDDDFNMPKGLAVLFDIVSTSNKILDTEADLKAKLAGIGRLVEEILDIFGVSSKTEEAIEISVKDIKKLIKTRSEYKQQKRYQEADDIREKLEKKGIILEDANSGTTYRIKL